MQLWDIRGGYCLQTFTGHESDINSIVVSQTCLDNQLMELTLNILVFPQWLRICYRKWWCHVSNVRHPVWPGAGRVQPRQHHLRDHKRRLQQERPPPSGRIWWLQLQCLGRFKGRESRFEIKMNLLNKRLLNVVNYQAYWLVMTTEFLVLELLRTEWLSAPDPGTHSWKSGTKPSGRR